MMHAVFLTLLTLLSLIQVLQGGSLHHSHQNLLLSGSVERRVLASSNTAFQPLAVKGNRIDPLRHFHKYRGGYDVENKHYWVSTAFTGIYGYAIAAVWLLVGIILALYGCIASCCCTQDGKHRNKPFREPPSSSNLYCNLSIILLTLLTILIVIGCGLLHVNGGLLHSKAKTVVRTIIQAADNATITIDNVTSTMSDMEHELQSYDTTITDYLKSTVEDLNKDAATLKEKVEDNKDKIDTAIRVLYIIIVVIGSLNLAFAIIGLVFIILFRAKSSMFLMMIVLCWILIVVDWVGFGSYFVINNFVDDTCLALKEYVQNPNNTTLDSILPCGDLRTASEEVSKARKELHELIIEANMNISILHEEGQTSGESIYQLVPFICNPFSGSPDYQYTGNCSGGSVTVGQIPEILKSFKCSSNESGKPCVNESVYDTIVAYSSAAQNFINIIPGLESLTNCSFVVNTFSLIVKQQCRPLKRAASKLWIIMAVVSALMIFLITTWVIRYRKEHKASGYKHFKRKSIMPHDTPSPSSID